MTFGRDKRLLLGALALVAPLPLPFNEVLGWGWYALFAAAVAVFLVRAHRDPESWLPNWASNLLALAYLPVLLADLSGWARGGLVAPMLRLGMFAVLVKLFSLRRERDKWHAVFGIFFLFLSAVATSVHMSMVLYLVAFLAASLLLLARFAVLHLLAGFGHRDPSAVRVPLAGFLATSVLAAVVLAVPLFALLPRVHTPYIQSPVAGGGGVAVGVTGFSDSVTLDSIGRVRLSRQVALRLTYDGTAPPAELRIKGGAFDRYERGVWRSAEVTRRLRGPAPLELDLAPDTEPVGSVEVWLRPLQSKGLPVPVEAVGARVPRRGLDLDRGGALRFRVPPRRPVEYTVELGRGGRSLAAPPPEGSASTLDTTGVTPRIAELAAEVAGTGDVEERADRLARFLIGEFEYTLDFVGRGGEDPLEEFLFTHRSGHCEYFATALALMLRSQGIHARLVTGFLGGERNPLGYLAVRQSNAHAWVEVYLPERGWTVYDPTPPAGRPGMARQSFVGLVSQVYDSLVFQWDRYVLTYGVEDQTDALLGVLRRVWSLFGRWGGDGEEAPSAAAAAQVPAGSTAAEAAPEESPDWRSRFLTVALLVLAGVLAALLWRRYREPFTATRAYRELRRRLHRSGLPLSEATAPLALERRAVDRWPAAAEPARRVVHLYLEESFGRRPMSAAEREELQRAVEAARRVLRAEG